MPCGIDTWGDGIVTLQIDLRNLAIVDDDCSCISETHVEEHVVRLVVLIAVTVDTLAFRPVITSDLIIENLSLFKRAQIALSNLHEIPCHIRRFNEAIWQIFVDRFWRHLYFKRNKCQPFVPFLTPHLYLEALALRGIEHGVPFLLRNLHFHAIAISLLFTIRRSETCHTRLVLVSRKHEVEGSYVARNSNIAIIRIDGRQTLGLFG